MAHRSDPVLTNRPHSPASPADELAASCAASDLKAFAGSGFDVDCVQVYAFRKGKLVAVWTAIAPKPEAG